MLEKYKFIAVIYGRTQKMLCVLLFILYLLTDMLFYGTCFKNVFQRPGN